MAAPLALVVGTAGHVDHGKTRLLEALTGTDCDRLAEEKRRGITIDLGFAHLDVDDVHLAFVDVPGHERFLHNALAGMGGFRLMLLVVAADEGVRPQTREHLAICDLLEIPAAVVALTKTDLVAPDLVDLARLEVEEILAATRFADAPVVPVSAVDGSGVPALRDALVAAARRVGPPPTADRPLRLPIDRAFVLKGLGVVVTGTVAAGVLRPGDGPVLLPGSAPVRVRSVQVHGSGREEARAGERAAAQLTGVELAVVERGMELVAPDVYPVTRRLLARVRLLPDAAPLAGVEPVRVHLHAAERIGKARVLGDGVLRPGETGTVEIRVASPVVAARGDRLILRRPSPAATIGGGEVVDPQPPAERRPAVTRLAEAAVTSPEEALLAWIRAAGEGGLATATLSRRLGEDEAAVEARLAALRKDAKLLQVPARPPRWIAPEAFSALTARATELLRDFFAKDRLAPGMPKAELVRRLLRGGAAELSDAYLEWLAKRGVLSLQGDRVNPPGRRAQLTGEESGLAARLVERYERAGLEPPSPGEAARDLAAKPQIVEGVLRHLVDQRRLVRLPGGLLIAASAVERLAADLRATGWERFPVPQFKERFGLSRKWAIPLLEHLDSVGVTRRIGDERMLVRVATPG